MNHPCIHCGAPAVRTVKALEIRTLHVRGFGGEHRVQTIGGELEHGVCERCVRECLDLSRSPFRSVRKQLTGFAVVFTGGLLIEAFTFLFLDGSRVFMLLGIAALVCGLLGVFDTIKGAEEKKRSLHALSESEALEEAAWDVFLARAPKKEGDSDLTYISVSEKTMKWKKGDLMVLYKLLPEIAVEAWNRLHSSPEEEKRGSADPPYRDVQKVRSASVACDYEIHE